MTAWFARRVFLGDRWADDVRLEADPGGTVTAVAEGATPDGAERLDGPVVPGVPNAHSHAFQLGVAGLTERAQGDDDFWSWREAMYRFVRRLDLARLEAVATHLYVRMVRAGYTSVAEFHYLHHRPDGRPWGDPAAASRALLRAARTAGIGITLLPVLYRWGGFGQAAPAAAQAPFLHDLDGFRALLEALAPELAGDPGARLGLALHSLRAVTVDEAQAALEAIDAVAPGAPVHVHVAEQTREVEECLRHTGRRPVAHLLASLPVDARWSLVHATHVEPAELDAIAASGATVALCPGTEANLGDGVFPLAAHLARGGRLAVGSDSQVSIDPFGELRLLELGQRLVARRRAVAASSDRPHPGARLVVEALRGGAAAVGRPVGALRVGARADFLVIDPDAPALDPAPQGDALLDALVFAGDVSAVKDVVVGGRRVVRDSRHPAAQEAARAHRAALAAIAAPPAGVPGDP